VSIANPWYEISDDGAPAGAIQWAFLLSFLPPLQGSLIRSSPPRAYAGLLSFRPFGPKYQKYAALAETAALPAKLPAIRICFAADIHRIFQAFEEAQQPWLTRNTASILLPISTEYRMH
jgi:hypothetical protein